MIYLSIIILAYKNQDKLRTTIRSVLNSHLQYSHEVIVVDNDSGDGTAEMVEKEFPEVKLIRNVNNGFSKGNNLGVKNSKGEYVLFLNPDTEVQKETLQECVRVLEERPDVGILGCKLIKGDGTLDLACRRSFPDPVNSFYRFSGLSFLFPKNKAFAKYNMTYLPDYQEAEVDSVSGAFLMIRRDVGKRVGFFDEDYFMYGEDLDLCWKVKHAGYKVLYYPNVTTYHYKGASSSKAPYRSLWHFHNAMWIFYKKHYAEKYSKILSALVYFGIWARFYLLVFRNSLRKKKYVSR